MIYFTPWYEYPVSVQKTYLALMLASSVNTTELWIGPIAPLNIETGKIVHSIKTFTSLLTSELLAPFFLFHD